MDSGTGWNGCYATHIVIRKGTHTVKLPDNVPDQIGATLNCALASMTNAVEPLMDLGNLEAKQEENKKKTVLVQVNVIFDTLILFFMAILMQQIHTCARCILLSVAAPG